MMGPSGRTLRNFGATPASLAINAHELPGIPLTTRAFASTTV
jgi:hypothetical protein